MFSSPLGVCLHHAVANSVTRNAVYVQDAKWCNEDSNGMTANPAGRARDTPQEAQVSDGSPSSTHLVFSQCFLHRSGSPHLTHSSLKPINFPLFSQGCRLRTFNP